MKLLLTGAAAGLVAAFAMSQFQNACLRAEGESTAMRLAGRPRTDEEVMARIADHLSKGSLTRAQRKAIAKLMHYGFGATAGAVYAFMADRSANVTRGFGTAFATTEFSIGELLAPPDLKPALPGHGKAVAEIYEWLTHLVFGASLEASRRSATQLIEAILPPTSR